MNKSRFLCNKENKKYYLIEFLIPRPTINRVQPTFNTIHQNYLKSSIDKSFDLSRTYI